MAEKVKDAAALPELPSRDELLRVLGTEAMKGHVPAIRLLLEEYRLDDNRDEITPFSDFDELAERRAAVGS